LAAVLPASGHGLKGRAGTVPAGSGGLGGSSRRGQSPPALRGRRASRRIVAGVPPCSVISAALEEPLYATAPYAPSWLLIEESGPWGAKAVAEAGFGELEARAKAAGVRVG